MRKSSYKMKRALQQRPIDNGDGTYADPAVAVVAPGIIINIREKKIEISDLDLLPQRIYSNMQNYLDRTMITEFWDSNVIQWVPWEGIIHFEMMDGWTLHRNDRAYTMFSYFEWGGELPQ